MEGGRAGRGGRERGSEGGGGGRRIRAVGWLCPGGLVEATPVGRSRCDLPTSLVGRSRWQLPTRGASTGRVPGRQLLLGTADRGRAHWTRPWSADPVGICRPRVRSWSALAVGNCRPGAPPLAVSPGRRSWSGGSVGSSRGEVPTRRVSTAGPPNFGPGRQIPLGTADACCVHRGCRGGARDAQWITMPLFCTRGGGAPGRQFLWGAADQACVHRGRRIQ